MYPYHASHKYERHGRHCHHTVVYIAGIIRALGYNLNAPEAASAEKLPACTHYNQNHGISETVSYTVEKTGPRLVHHRKGLKTPHQNTVCYYKAYIYGQLHADIIRICFEYLTDNSDKCRHHDKLHYDAYPYGNSIAYQ